MKKIILSENEKNIMDIFWKESKALSTSDIIESPHPRNWKDSSIHILINSLLKKGAIEIAGFVKTSKTYARTFKPTISYEDYSAMQLLESKSYKNCSLPKIVASLIDHIEDAEERDSLIKDLEKIISNKKEEE